MANYEFNNDNNLKVKHAKYNIENNLDYNVKYMRKIYKKVNYNNVIWNYAKKPVATFIFAAGLELMDCEFMTFIAENLALNGVNVARFEFPF